MVPKAKGSKKDFSEILKAFSQQKGYKKKRLEKWIEGFPELKQELIMFGISCFISDTFREMFPEVSDSDINIIGFFAGKFTYSYLTNPEEIKNLSEES